MGSNSSGKVPPAGGVDWAVIWTVEVAWTLRKGEGESFDPANAGRAPVRAGLSNSRSARSAFRWTVMH
jgi:hypothetical protein